ncbi:site-specific integrase [Variovorax sp. J22R133]|uniref:site-specific integrase n=1 Tax=Variovorax brevis TaxID=3053503 RepID=UPI002576F8DB|nr:site-specific integrase [Variovorax sp. J22R133]MDM0117891.1 site-specific integrase [Variovorax sp. J22R133]
MKFVINSQVVLLRAPEGPIAPYLGAFADSLDSTGYATTWIHRHVLLGACFSQWLGQKAVALQDVTSDHVTRHLQYRARRARPRPDDRGVLMHLMCFLRREGVVPGEKPAVAEPSWVDRCIRAYEAYLREQRALATVTIVNYVQFVREFLEYRFGAGVIMLSGLSAADVVRFVQHEVPRLHVKRAKLMTCALRSFLSYARFCGDVDVDLAAAVPVVPNWTMTSIPRAIAPKQVRQLLASIDRRTAVGRRDYAIVLLLARLGLRSGEVASLKLDDIDWNMGQLRVHGKSGHRNELPLPVDVGRAIAAYLTNGRPTTTSRNLFLRVRAPVCAFQGSSAIGSIVRHRLERGGVDAPTFGAHQFRHGLATEMLRRGASLGEIGDVLGHRHSQTTMIYTKVDLQALRKLAPPWPKGAP